MSSFEGYGRPERMDENWGCALQDALRNTVFMGNDKVVQHLHDRHVICYLPSEKDLVREGTVTGKKWDAANGEWHVTVNVKFWGSLSKYELQKREGEKAAYRVNHTLTIAMPWDPAPAVPYVLLGEKEDRDGIRDAEPDFLHHLRPAPEIVRARRIGLLIAGTAFAVAIAIGAYSKWGAGKMTEDDRPTAASVTPKRTSPPPLPLSDPSTLLAGDDPLSGPGTRERTFSLLPPLEFPEPRNRTDLPR